MNALLRFFTPCVAPSRRDESIDLMRGFTMLTVVLYHVGLLCCCSLVDRVFGKMFLNFSMPFYFLLSGYMLFMAGTVRKTGFWQYAAKRFWRILLPYFLFELLFLGISLHLGGVTDVPASLKAIALCKNTEGTWQVCFRLWFLPCLFVANMLAYPVLRWVRHPKALWGCVGGFMLLAWVSPYLIHCDGTKELLPCTLDISFMAASFILAGSIGGERIREWVYGTDRARVKKWGWYAFLAFVAMGYIKGGVTIMFIHCYGIYPLAFLCGCLGSLACAVWMRFYSESPCRFGKNFLIWMGRNGLIIFPLHLLLLFFLREAIGMEAYVRFPGILTLPLLLLLIPTVNFFNTFLPFMGGDFSFLRRWFGKTEQH